MKDQTPDSLSGDEPNIFELAKMFQCHSHGYMCQDCPQPEEAEIVKILEAFLKSSNSNLLNEVEAEAPKDKAVGNAVKGPARKHVKIFNEANEKWRSTIQTIRERREL